jgi:hypothetical protein
VNQPVANPNLRKSAEKSEGISEAIEGSGGISDNYSNEFEEKSEEGFF